MLTFSIVYVHRDIVKKVEDHDPCFCRFFVSICLALSIEVIQMANVDVYRGLLAFRKVSFPGNLTSQKSSKINIKSRF